MSKNITSANSSWHLTIDNLYPTPKKIDGYAADNMATTDGVDLVETVMGADGIFHAGKIFNPTSQNFQLMPDSNGCEVFANWVQAQETARDVYRASATFIYPSIGKKFTCTDGYLTNAPKFPSAGRVLQAMQFTIQWGSVTVEDI